MNDSPDRDLAVFAEAFQLPPGERSTYLERACGADEELRQRVERLLNGPSQPKPAPKRITVIACGILGLTGSGCRSYFASKIPADSFGLLHMKSRIIK